MGSCHTRTSENATHPPFVSVAIWLTPATLKLFPPGTDLWDSILAIHRSEAGPLNRLVIQVA